jgi:type I restriction enzyme, S subunit
MKAGWKTVKLGEVARYDKVQGIHSGLPYVGLEHIESGTRKFIGSRSDMEVQSSSFLFNPHHVLYGRLRPYLRKVLVPDFAGHCSTEIFPILPSSDLDRSYLSYWLIAEFTTSAIDRLCNGARMPRANMEQALELEIPLPPLAEQKRIVALLDEAFAGIDKAEAKAEASIKRNADLFKSLLQSSFANQDPEWVEMTLENCCEQIFAGGDVPKGRLSDDRTKEFNVPIYANGEKDEGLYGFTDIARVTKPSITVSARGTLGFTAIRTEPFFPIVRLIVLVPDDEKITLPFLYHAISGMDFGNTGTSIPQLTVPNFKESKLRLPCLQTQNAVTGKIDTIKEKGESLRRLHEQKLSMLKELKNSLLAQAFAGELTA